MLQSSKFNLIKMLKIAFSPVYQYQLPEGHRFPMIKYELIPEQLLRQGIIESSQFFEPEVLPEKWLLRTHCTRYWEQLKSQSLPSKIAKAIGFPLSDALLHRGRVISQGTLECAIFAQKYGIAMNIAGGTHHAYKASGGGFCVLNDIAIASNYLLDKQLAQQILVIDLDVHQGNGTAHIFKDDSRVFTFSMHGAKNYPVRKEASDCDIPLEDAIEDEAYLSILKEQLLHLSTILKPDAVFYLSGVDVLASDRLGRLSLSLEGCKERDRMVFEWCKMHQYPVAVSMGGGYSTSLAQIVDAHCNTFKMAMEVYDF